MQALDNRGALDVESRGARGRGQAANDDGPQRMAARRAVCKGTTGESSGLGFRRL